MMQDFKKSKERVDKLAKVQAEALAAAEAETQKIRLKLSETQA